VRNHINQYGVEGEKERVDFRNMVKHIERNDRLWSEDDVGEQERG